MGTPRAATPRAGTPRAGTPHAAAAAPKALVTLAIIGAWYASNIGVIMTNKYLLSVYEFR